MVSFYYLIACAVGPLILSYSDSGIESIYYALIVLALRLLFKLIQAKVISDISYKVETNLRADLANKLISIGPLSNKRESSLSASFVDAMDDIIPYFTHYLVSARYALALPLVILIAVFFASPINALILGGLCPLIPIFMILIGKGAEKLNQRQWVRILRLSTHFTETLQRISFIKLFNLENQETKIIASMSRRWRKQTMQILRIAFLSALALEFFATVGVAFCAIALGFKVYYDGFSYVNALFVLLCAPEFFLPLRVLGQNYHIRMKSLGAISNIAEIMSQDDLIKKEGSDIEVNKFDIVFENVQAIYPNGFIGINNLSTKIKEGEVTALVGVSGCGKSTMLQSLMGFINIREGSIKIGGVNINDISNKKLRGYLSYIPQNPHLFFGTLRDNLKLAKEDASDEELINALGKVGAKFLLDRFDQGLDHKIGDQNQGISGGEARLIALARTVLKDSPIILLDEPTASLDFETQDLFIKALDVIKQGKTVILVAHREDLIKVSDTVIDVSLINKIKDENNVNS